ncbi:bacitracin resistance BacA family protein [Anoxybacillus sp. B7M1]|uniref:Undecaprenyl-diphosphatase n=1 Tax=Anoxybacteroides rupiense TaxID=311460 RepID=A0ABD5IRL7_9BACL|nr:MULTISPECIES: undecaprenyl-diphosphate phosphatase [Anoxybacillus]ANB56481.1 bacitracin resistance BacA family protein [Anoxybacillus sp. B2M1]ANB63160.1 bacitracin resistance BacA family protein [Anoxybacillus sp. B7M1]KXG11364.1 Undecaprenyl-diphosphatase [Anoxybacillus sp. P3H1B]MBB3907310.1 undecaprenyl-diphosphatase [Anoxybacillus rupiensis]MBS2769948.1 undecaprenyl-diphosphate phosphatase [Anoxybacillus rupiensis]
MSKLEAFILGIIQGLTEFLPISSTGHLYLGRHLFGLDEAGLFLDTMLHIGTLFAVFAIYKKELLYMIRRPFSKLTFLLIVGTIPAVVIGLLLQDYFEEISKTGVTIGWEFLITGVFLWFADGIKNGYKRMENLSYTDAFVIGMFQAAAIFPAISRSGLTIVGGLMRKLDRETAAYFSFLLSIPAIAGAIVLQFVDVFAGKAENISAGALFMGTLSSAIFGYIAVRWMIQYLQRHSLKAFAVYVSILGLLVLSLQMTGVF